MSLKGRGSAYQYFVPKMEVEITMSILSISPKVITLCLYGVQCRVAPSSSHSVSGVKQPRTGLVLGWVISESLRQTHRLKLTLNEVGA